MGSERQVFKDWLRRTNTAFTEKQDEDDGDWEITIDSGNLQVVVWFDGDSGDFKQIDAVE